MSVRLGAETARELLAGSRFWLLALGGAAVVVLFGLHVRTSGSAGADRTLLDVALGFVVPLVCYAAFEAVHRRERTWALVAPLARHGADRHELALGLLLVLSALAGLVTALFAVLAVGSATTASPALVSELFTCAWGGALAGAGYAGLFAIGSLWGRRGRLWCLFGDWVLGSGTGAFAFVWPRGHARSLLGGEPVLDTPPGFAAVVLATLALVYVLRSARRGPS